MSRSLTPTRHRPAPASALGARLQPLAAALAPHTAPLRERWSALAPRERRMVGWAAAAVGLLLVWQIAVQPALNTLRTVPAQRAALDLQLAEMQLLAQEARELRALPPISPEQAEAALRAAVTRLGANAKLQMAGDRATITLTGLDAATLTGWLAEVRGAARARVVELQVNRIGALYGGSVVLALGRPG
ncbi:type II secretion system protein GspM [Leptothrix discophora]|uniref:Type II secretion system protein GspM n=1 Tax=Leptothrix discophora TaxID=89 RepID=A0ABT9G5Z0_LEPDI|nr:type II secretion system protein GspM [Leptothrix discophora]MDP4301912.1 type II secretion system protein GspM [Leptothrix discophora]